MVLFGTLELKRSYIYSCNINLIRINCDFSLNWEPGGTPPPVRSMSNIVEHLREEKNVTGNHIDMIWRLVTKGGLVM